MMRVLKRNAGYVCELRAQLLGEESKRRLLYAMLGAVLFSLAAHAYAYFSFAPLHDAVNYIDYHSGAWEISLGRYLEPLYGMIRGIGSVLKGKKEPLPLIGKWKLIK